MLSEFKRQQSRARFCLLNKADWLPLQWCVQFKLASLIYIYNVLYTGTPSCLAELLYHSLSSSANLHILRTNLEFSPLLYSLIPNPGFVSKNPTKPICFKLHMSTTSDVLTQLHNIIFCIFCVRNLGDQHHHSISLWDKQHQFLQARCPSCYPTKSVKALKEIQSIIMKLKLKAKRSLSKTSSITSCPKIL